jgi:L-alanine-DL-glutamate epimerase-like enolase superfamily enzyme
MNGMSPTLSRRKFLANGAAVSLLASFPGLAEPLMRRYKIRDIKCMVLSGDRTYTLVKVVADNGMFGIAEAYGSPAIGTKQQILELKPLLVGKDPLGIDAIYTEMGRGGNSLAGTRTDGSAHNLMRAASGIEMALWDLAGKILGVSTTTLLGGKFRDRVRVYDHAAPRDMLDKASCREWADKIKSDPSGFTAHKIGARSTDLSSLKSRTANSAPRSRDENRVLTTKELIDIGKGFENCREAIGWDHDIMVHCHWEYDLRTSIQLAEVVAPIKPLWLEDPLGVDYTDSWKRLVAASPVPICTGENLERRAGFNDFLINQALDILNPDLRNSGGFLETKRIADMADVYGLPMATHNTGSQLNTWAACQWAGAIRDYLACETITGQGGWMDQLLQLDGPYIKEGFIPVVDKPGLGAELNPDVVKAHLADGETWWG